MSDLIALDHPRFRWAQRDIFVKRVTPDCMSHRCLLLERDDRVKLDACCQYGVDVDLAERNRILARRDEIGALLDQAVAGRPWFGMAEVADRDFASGAYVRTTTHDDGCIFLAHDRRGCAIHRASVEGGWDLHGTKPHVCRLFPLSYDHDTVLLSDDYADYSCSQAPNAPSVYRVGRADLGQIFGPELVAALDDAEARARGERAA